MVNYIVGHVGKTYCKLKNLFYVLKLFQCVKTVKKGLEFQEVQSYVFYVIL